MTTLTVPSPFASPRGDKPLSPQTVSIIWRIADALDEKRTPATVPNAIWLELATSALRGPGARSDNVWLRKCLQRLSGLQLSGEYKGSPWGAVLLAEWQITEGGAKVRLLIPPAGIHALRVPATFVKIEELAAVQLPGHARRLYGLLADRKRQARKSWTYSLEELRFALGVEQHKSYNRFNNFRQRVLEPAVKAINDFGTVNVTMTPKKVGRSVDRVEFSWSWKSPDAAIETVTENERHSSARRKRQTADDAPPMIEEEPQREAALEWWGKLTQMEREAWSDRVGRFIDDDPKFMRREADIARNAHEAFLSKQPAAGTLGEP